MTEKRNAVLYLDAEPASKTRELDFNHSKTFQNHLKTLLNQSSNVYTQNTSANNVSGSPGQIQTPVQTSDGSPISKKQEKRTARTKHTPFTPPNQHI
jgi:hypothetical protein